jgi:hypothetical protein
MQERAVAMQPGVARHEDASVNGFRFFMPSAELTKAVMKQNQQLVSEYVERNFPPGYQSTETESENEDGSLLGRLELEKLATPSTVDHERQTLMGKRLISERLYHYLSSLAETPRALEGADFPLWEYLPDGMATMLGLSAYRDMPRDSARAMEIRQLLERITLEFRNWLLEEQHGIFVTPWIEIGLSEGDDLRLTALEEEPQLVAESFGAYSEVSPQSETTTFDLNNALAQTAASED